MAAAAAAAAAAAGTAGALSPVQCAERKEEAQRPAGHRHAVGWSKQGGRGAAGDWTTAAIGVRKLPARSSIAGSARRVGRAQVSTSTSSATRFLHNKARGFPLEVRFNPQFIF